MSEPGVGSTRGRRPVLEHVRVVANDRVAEGVGLLALHAPHLAATVAPGQFAHLRIAEGRDFVLRRPFSIHNAAGDTVEILYQVLGRGTRELSLRARGEGMDLIGPLGHGWDIPGDADHALVVTGGLGAAPMGLLVEALAGRGVAVTVAMGAPTRERLVGRDLLAGHARRVEVATEDGSEGERGLVTGLVEGLIAADEPDIVYACGPEAMQLRVAGQASRAGLPCQVSLERLMACGVGACLSCVVSTRSGPKRACADGPVFDAEEILWEASWVPPRHARGERG